MNNYFNINIKKLLLFLLLSFLAESCAKSNHEDVPHNPIQKQMIPEALSGEYYSGMTNVSFFLLPSKKNHNFVWVARKNPSIFKDKNITYDNAVEHLSSHIAQISLRFDEYSRYQMFIKDNYSYYDEDFEMDIEPNDCDEAKDEEHVKKCYADVKKVFGTNFEGVSLASLKSELKETVDFNPKKPENWIDVAYTESSLKSHDSEYPIITLQLRISSIYDEKTGLFRTFKVTDYDEYIISQEDHMRRTRKSHLNAKETDWLHFVIKERWPKESGESGLTGNTYQLDLKINGRDLGLFYEGEVLLKDKFQNTIKRGIVKIHFAPK